MFIKPSTATGLTSPYGFKGTLPSVAQNYIDLNFSNALDKTGDTIIGSTIIFQGATVDFNAASTLTINGSDFFNMFGAMTTGATSTITLVNGSNMTFNSGSNALVNGSFTFFSGSILEMFSGSGIQMLGTSNINFASGSSLTLASGSSLTVTGATGAIAWTSSTSTLAFNGGSTLTVNNSDFCNLFGTTAISNALTITATSILSNTLTLLGTGQVINKVNIVNGGVSYSIDAGGAGTDQYVGINNTAVTNPYPVILPSAAANFGRLITVFDASYTAATYALSVRIVGGASFGIGGAGGTTQAIAFNGQGLSFISDGTHWFLIDG